MANLEIGEARGLVQRNSRIADTTAIRQNWLNSPRPSAVLSELGQPPAGLVSLNRKANLEPFMDYFNSEVGPFPGSLANVEPLVPNLLDKLAVARMPRLRNFFPDGMFASPDLSVEAFFENAFSREENGMLTRWMNELDKKVEASSEANLDAIDEAAQRGEVIKKDIVIVGGGPLTSVVASVLGPYYDVTVITDQSGLGKPWRNRPLYINSSAAAENDGKRLPLLDGTTTPVGAGQLFNTLDSDVLLLGDTKKVGCDDGSTREYVSGPALGDLVATNIVMNASDFIVGQTVDVDVDPFVRRQTQRVRLSNGDGDELRYLDARAVIFLTGPGSEECVISDFDSESDYYDCVEELYDNISASRQEIKEKTAEIEALKNRKQTRAVQAKISQLEEEVRRVNIELPRILTLTGVEAIYEFWREDLNSDPNRFPLDDVINKGSYVGFVGSGDTSKTLKELVDGKAPKRAYPQNYEITNPATTFIYNEQSANTDEYDRNNRRRYKGGFTQDSTVGIPYKVNTCLVERNADDTPRGVTVTNTDVLGDTRERTFDYVFVATGFTPADVASNLESRGVEVGLVKDKFGNVVAKGNSRENIYVAGSATGFTAKDFPPSIRNIINGLGISENTIALWVHSLLAERLAWTIAAKLPFNQEKIKRLTANS